MTENIYSSGLYPVLSKIFGWISGRFPFSLAQWVLIGFALAVLTYIILMLRKIIRKDGKRSLCAARLLVTLTAAASVVYFIFIMSCGLNYNRQSFAQLNGLEVRPSSAAELAELCESLAQQANESSRHCRHSDTGATAPVDNNYYALSLEAPAAFLSSCEKYPVLSGYLPRTKPVFFSRAMSAANISGIYTPFTFEANVNVDLPYYQIPSSMLHELAHYKGFMREEEANFIAYIVSRESENPDFVYSGAMLALTHSLNALYGVDREAYYSINERLNETINADYAAHAAYWKQFEGPVSKVSNKVNDVYLKVNRQQAGIRSYGQMVDLLLADYRSRTA